MMQKKLKTSRFFNGSVLSKISPVLCIATALTGCINAPNSESQAAIKSYKDFEYKKSFSKNRKVILVGGCFDVLHIGHIEFLNAAKKKGDYLIVALEPDASIENYKQRKPIHTQHQRAKILSHIRDVDEVLLLPSLKGFEAYKKLVEDIHPAIIGITQGDPQVSNKKLQAKHVDAEVIEVMPHLDGYSSSTIIGKK